MESLLKDFDIPAKNPSEEAQRRWRCAVTVVKNRRRRFRMIVDLAKKSEAKTKLLKIQIPTLDYQFSFANGALTVRVTLRPQPYMKIG
ncbi:calcium-transporting ATPase 1, plasma membrane-type-like [Camellia sinensis]|uniref:calcium-transporting ATPase 1, plasma membrane-type-like n=1 Tax=Camellia sinensis TaxID=4442 RepID=UPI00103685D6|nr:calcium-transporting ATPase 1, plasma membrane-type-like [Camellia sinensis]